MAGIAFEKGAHGLLHDNQFIDNGCGPDVYDNWRAAIVSNFDITLRVPSNQNPLVYNNVFVNNYHALTVEYLPPHDYDINMPHFMDNIVYYPQQGAQFAITRNASDSCRLVSRNNFYFCNWLQFEPESVLALMCSNDRGSDVDPKFVNPASDFHLKNDSLCINAGFISLSPGIISESGYQDYHILDIGYHFYGEIGAIGSVRTLRAIDDDTIAWTAPDFGDPNGYVVIWEDDTGQIAGTDYDVSGLTYDIDPEMTGIGLLFGVSAYTDEGAFGTPAFIEM